MNEGFVPISIKVSTKMRIKKLKGEKSYDEFLNMLLDFYERRGG